MRAFFVLIPLMFGPSFALGVDLSTPMVKFIAAEDRETFERGLATDCPGKKYSLRSAARVFVGGKFYRDCIAPQRLARYRFSPFFQVRRPWEQILGRALAVHSLTLQMTEREMTDHEAGLTSVLFENLDTVEVTNDQGGGPHTFLMGYLGIRLIKDFVRAYDEEMKLPVKQRFIKSWVHDPFSPHRYDASHVPRLKAAIDARLNERGLEPSRPTRMN